MCVAAGLAGLSGLIAAMTMRQPSAETSAPR